MSYDDITPHYRPAESIQTQGQPPTKKRKKNNKRSKIAQRLHHNLHEKISSSPHTPLDDQIVEMEEAGGEFGDECRELSHEEIWDDSSLVEAWEAAQQEYEMYHGNDKDWKKEPVKKSPL